MRTAAVPVCPGVTEEVLLTDDGLVGIISSPEGRLDTSRPVVVILNSGVIHRVGSCRVSVELARRLASSGHGVLRLDHSGIGDSPPSRSGLEMEASQVAEIVSAMNAVQHRTGARQFVIYGLCSGARGAFNAALEDSRIVGIVQVDGFAYRTSRYFLVRAIQRLRDPASLLRLIGRRSRLLKPVSPSEPADDMWVQQWPDYPPRQVVERGYLRLVERHVRVFAIYTGSWDDVYNYPRQFLDMYPRVQFGNLLTIRHLPSAKHILPDPHDRDLVMREVVRWVSEEFSPTTETGKATGVAASRSRAFQ